MQCPLKPLKDVNDHRVGPSINFSGSHDPLVSLFCPTPLSRASPLTNTVNGDDLNSCLSGIVGLKSHLKSRRAYRAAIFTPHVISDMIPRFSACAVLHLIAISRASAPTHMTPLVVDADVRAKSYTEAKKLQPSFPAPNNQTGDRPFSQPRALDFRPDTHQTSALGRCQNDVFLLANQGFLHALATCSSFSSRFPGLFHFVLRT